MDATMATVVTAAAAAAAAELLFAMMLSTNHLLPCAPNDEELRPLVSTEDETRSVGWILNGFRDDSSRDEGDSGGETPTGSSAVTRSDENRRSLKAQLASILISFIRFYAFGMLHVL